MAIGDSIKRVLDKARSQRDLSSKRKKLDDLFIPPGVFDKETEEALMAPVGSASSDNPFEEIRGRTQNVTRGLDIRPFSKRMQKAIQDRDIFAYQSEENRLRDAVDFDRELPLEVPDPEQIKRSKRRNQSRRGGRRSTLLTSGMGMGGSGYGLGG